MITREGQCSAVANKTSWAMRSTGLKRNLRIGNIKVMLKERVYKRILKLNLFLESFVYFQYFDDQWSQDALTEGILKL